MLADLRQSIKDNALTLHYQPKVGMRNHEVLGLEALVRWRHPVHGPVSPLEFIPLLERTGSIWLLTGWVIRTVVQQMADWKKQGFEPDVSINLSASDLLEPRMPEVIVRALQASGVSSRKLVLEITESALMHEPEQAIRTMERLRKDEFRFSVDDFGTGYSSLSQFKRLPVDEIKIDKSFVQAMTAGSDDALIVKATIDLGHSFGVKVVAEGIETPECWRLLMDLGCDYAQGYLISKPLPADEVMAYIRLLNGKLEFADSPTVQIRALQEQAASGSPALSNA
jgi:EAL domain-containing protein (putative c-di-GMP-specific phosphodiesterase class I)